MSRKPEPDFGLRFFFPRPPAAPSALLFVGYFLLTNPRPRDTTCPMRKDDAYELVLAISEDMWWRVPRAFLRGELRGKVIWSKNGRALGFRILPKHRAEVERIADNRRWRRKRH